MTDPRAGRATWVPGPVTSVGGAPLLDVILRMTLSEDPHAIPTRTGYVLDPGYRDPFGPRCPDPWVVPPRHPRTCDGIDLMCVADEALDQADFVRVLLGGL